MNGKNYETNPEENNYGVTEKQMEQLKMIKRIIS